MIRRCTLACLPVLAAALSGCIARTVLDVATAPVRAAGMTADMATTSQSEADEKRGRALRQRDGRLGKLDRDLARHMRACDAGDDHACAAAAAEQDRIERLEDAPY